MRTSYTQTGPDDDPCTYIARGVLHVGHSTRHGIESLASFRLSAIETVRLEDLGPVGAQAIGVLLGFTTGQSIALVYEDDETNGSSYGPAREMFDLITEAISLPESENA